ncbi:MAG: DUF975 family protein [Clostridia bacterium]|nr:DUF975 family protein [Clostridia bacterium]
MEKTYLKLNAKKIMMKCSLRCFLVSVLPFVSIVILTASNYYLLMLLKGTKFNMYISPYAEYIRLLLMTTSSLISFFIWKSLRLVCDNYFLRKSLNKKVTFFKAFQGISFRQCLVFSLVSVVKFLLSISWGVVYLSPCIAVSALLIYSYRFENNGFNLNLTLFISSIILLFIGISFLYITLKRYSMCSSIILSEEERNPIKVIEQSIGVMDGHCVSYALYCLSFLGWLMSSLLIIPAFYVFPYIAMGKWCYRNPLGIKETVVEEKEKPIIFYINKRVES